LIVTKVRLPHQNRHLVLLWYRCGIYVYMQGYMCGDTGIYVVMVCVTYMCI
jgi:hypothetical protein